jgi:hypothetical protein
MFALRPSLLLLAVTLATLLLAVAAAPRAPAPGTIVLTYQTCAYDPTRPLNEQCTLACGEVVVAPLYECVMVKAAGAIQPLNFSRSASLSSDNKRLFLTGWDEQWPINNALGCACPASPSPPSGPCPLPTGAWASAIPVTTPGWQNETDCGTFYDAKARPLFTLRTTTQVWVPAVDDEDEETPILLE